jgi:hypothetical protein
MAQTATATRGIRTIPLADLDTDARLLIDDELLAWYRVHTIEKKIADLEQALGHAKDRLRAAREAVDEYDARQEVPA